MRRAAVLIAFLYFVCLDLFTQDYEVILSPGSSAESIVSGGMVYLSNGDIAIRYGRYPFNPNAPEVHFGPDNPPEVYNHGEYRIARIDDAGNIIWDQQYAIHHLDGQAPDLANIGSSHSGGRSLYYRSDGTIEVSSMVFIGTVNCDGSIWQANRPSILQIDETDGDVIEHLISEEITECNRDYNPWTLALPANNYLFSAKKNWEIGYLNFTLDTEGDYQILDTDQGFAGHFYSENYSKLYAPLNVADGLLVTSMNVDGSERDTSFVEMERLNDILLVAERKKHFLIIRRDHLFHHSETWLYNPVSNEKELLTIVDDAFDGSWPTSEEGNFWISISTKGGDTFRIHKYDRAKDKTFYKEYPLENNFKKKDHIFSDDGNFVYVQFESQYSNDWQSPLGLKPDTVIVRKYNIEDVNIPLDDCDTSLTCTVYPNPTDGPIVVEYNQDLEEPASIRLVNGKGKIVYSTTTNAMSTEMDLSSLPIGVYILDISNSTPRKIVLANF